MDEQCWNVNIERNPTNDVLLYLMVQPSNSSLVEDILFSLSGTQSDSLFKFFIV